MKKAITALQGIAFLIMVIGMGGMDSPSILIPAIMIVAGGLTILTCTYLGSGVSNEEN